jgi:GNAT superfamily N-acetyltransferase
VAAKDSSELTIRQYRDQDQPQVWAMAALPSFGSASDPDVPVPLPDADSAPDAYPDLADVSSTYVLAGGDFLVADVGGAIVGTAGIRISGKRSADVIRVRVHPAMRRQGIGTALLEAVERRAAELNIRRLQLDTEENPEGALEFYLASGFHKVGDEDDEDAENRWDISMFSKSLRSDT